MVAEMLFAVLGLFTLVGGVLGIAALIAMAKAPYRD